MPRRRKVLSQLALCALLLGWLPAANGLAGPAARPDGSKVHEAVLSRLRSDGVADFYAVLSVQADLAGASALPTKAQKTAYVYEHLTRVAAETQGPLAEYLRARGVAFRQRYIQNLIEVRGAGWEVVGDLAARADVAQLVPLPDPRLDPLEGAEAGLPGPTAVEWNVARVHAPEVWEMGIRGEGVVLASNDTGVDYTHPALVNQYRGNLGGGVYDHNRSWWNGPGDAFPHDEVGHGTHTTGTMVGDDGAGNQVGVAPEARWIACGALAGSDPVECFEFFLAPWDLNGQNPDPALAPDGINNSWYDASGFDYRPIIQNLNAAGIAVVKSAGNWGPGCQTISSPGDVPEVLATAAFDREGALAEYSSRGPSDRYGSPVPKPELSAPGVEVRSSVPGGGYATYSGTSMAAPHTTAALALIWSAAPCLRGDLPRTNEALLETAEARPGVQCPPFVGRPNDNWGWGVLDCRLAVRYAAGLCEGLGTLLGTVSEAGSGQPIEGARVRAQGSHGLWREGVTDGNGAYSLDLVAGTYSLSASHYGYAPVEEPDIVLAAGQTTVRDAALPRLPEFVVRGSVLDRATGAPLAATVEFLDAPVPPVNTDPATGAYSLRVAQGTWQLKAASAGHRPEVLKLEVIGDTVQDLLLERRPCLLLVDDDDDYPDVRPYFEAALQSMGVSYDLFDVGGEWGNGPDLIGLQGYRMVVWFSGDKWSDDSAGPNYVDEANLASYLLGGGNLFLSSQDYLYDMGLTTFGQDYLGVSAYVNDRGDATGKAGVPGDPIGEGMGTLGLTYPRAFADYGDQVEPGAGASTAFRAANNGNNLDLDRAGANWKTVFFGTDWVPLYYHDAQNGVRVLQRIVDWFGGCEVGPVTTLTCGEIGAQGRIDPYGRRVLKWKVPVVDEGGAPVGGIAVHADLTSPGGGPFERVRMSKPGTGLASFPWGSQASGRWTIDVTDMQGAGYQFLDGPACSASTDW